MTLGNAVTELSDDPVIVALAALKPIDLDVIQPAIDYREAQIRELRRQVDTLKIHRNRVLNLPAD